MKNIVKYLTKWTRIPGVNGFGNWRIVEQGIGKKDGKNGQLSEVDGNYTTAWIEGKHNCLHSYMNKTFLKTNQALEEVFKEVYSNNVEYKMLLTVNESDSTETSEEGRRQAAAVAEKNANAEKRKEEILLRMAEIKGYLETVDKALLNNLERAEGTLQFHIASYWRGLVKTTSKELPAYPGVVVKGVRGKKVYEEHLEKVQTVLDQILV